MTWEIAGKRVLITGGNTGVGEATAMALARRGAKVTITSRNAERGHAAVRRIQRASGAEVELLMLDLASLDSIEACRNAWGERTLDVLINNAGLVLSRRQETADGFETTLGVNHIGPFYLTRLLLDVVVETTNARIINLASSAHQWAVGGFDFEDPNMLGRYNGWAAYGRSKLANILFTRELAKRLRGAAVSAFAVHPGVVATRFAADGDVSKLLGWLIRAGHPFMKTPENGARTSVYCATQSGLESKTGGYFAGSKEAKSNHHGKNDAAAERLWLATEAWIAAKGREVPAVPLRGRA